MGPEIAIGIGPGIAIGIGTGIGTEPTPKAQSLARIEAQFPEVSGDWPPSPTVTPTQAPAPDSPKASSKQPPKFYPATPIPWFRRFVQLLSSNISRWGYKMDLEIAPEDLARLKALNHERVVLFPNHPTFREPILLYVLSQKVGKPFYYMAAYELFNSVMGKVFQSIGVYSIRRGLVDRASIKATVDLLMQPACHLVLFLEGRCSFQSDRVMPFQSGGVQLAFQAMGKLAKQGESADMYAVPIAVRYRYNRKDIDEVVEETMAEVEAGLGMQAADIEAEDAEKQRYLRLRAIAERVLCNIEADYPELLQSEAERGDWNDRMAHLRKVLLAKSEASLGLSVNENQPTRDRAYRIQAALKDRPEPEAPGSLSSALIRKSVERLLNLDAIYDGYVAENPVPERFLDTLARFQREVFNIDEPPPKGLRKARMKVGDPINMKDWLAGYKGDRSGTVQTATEAIQQAVQGKLDELVLELAEL